VSFDEHATFLDRDLVSGGSPWRLLRLTSPSFAVATRWRANGVVRAGEERFARTLVQQGLLHPHFEVPLAMDEIDVVVPVYEDVESLATLLGSLAGFHVTVVDDGSRNAVAIARCVEEFHATLLRLPANHGPAFARNKGALASARPFLWFVDVDIELGDPRDIARSLHNEFVRRYRAAISRRGGPHEARTVRAPLRRARHGRFQRSRRTRRSGELRTERLLNGAAYVVRRWLR
jgi:hypothetical protein